MKEHASSGTLNLSLTFENFVCTRSNKLAYEACKSFAQFETNIPNLLMLYGPPAVGKTHLLCAIGNYVNENVKDKSFIFTTSENFTNQLVAAIRAKGMTAFRSRWRNVDLLLMDDIHFVAGREATQEEFYHVFNDVTRNGGLVVLTSAHSPGELQFSSDQLMSRITMGLLFELKRPTEGDLYSILTKKFQNVTFPIPDPLIKLITAKSRRDVRRAEGICRRVVFSRSKNGSYPSESEIISWFEKEQVPAIFLSYAWADKEAVLAVDQWLRDKGARVILDERDFWAGDDIQEQILSYIQQASAVVCFYSQHSANRPYPRFERRLAEELQRNPQKATRVIYFCLDHTELPPQQQYRLAVIAQGRGFEEACNELWRGIVQQVGRPERIDLGKYREKPPW